MRNALIGMGVLLALAASCRESGPASWEIVSFEDLVASVHLADDMSRSPEVLAAVPDGEGGVCVVYQDRVLKFGRWSREGVATENQVVDPDVVYAPDSVVLVLDRERRPHVAFADRGRKKIRYAFCDGEEWTRADVLAYAEPYRPGEGMPDIKMVLDSRSRPHIFIFRTGKVSPYGGEGPRCELTYARPEGAGWTLEAVDSWPFGYDGFYYRGGLADVAVSEGDVFHVCYYAPADSGKVVKYRTRGKHGWETEAVADALYFEQVSLEIGERGKLHVCFSHDYPLGGFQPGIYYAEREEGRWTFELAYPAARFRSRYSFAVNEDGVPFIAYYEVDSSGGEREPYRLKVARRSGREWSVVTVEEMDVVDPPVPKREIAMNFDSRGRPCVAYLGQTGTASYVKTARLVGGDWPAPPRE